MLDSWGTKGDNALPMDLGVAHKATDTDKGIEAVEVELEDGQDMINRHYNEALQNLQTNQEPITQVSYMWNGKLEITHIKFISYIESSTSYETR